MIIKTLTASYGRLNGERLELQPGLNIITSGNESGKSTWCSFIKNMLYGVSSSAREKGGVKPDKVKFAPWSGRPMEGSMELECALGQLTISRRGKESAPLREVSVTHPGGVKAQGSFSPAPGQTILGISREIFQRTAFIGQGGMAVTSGPELEGRITALIQTGEENASRSQAVDTLRAAARRRRYNKSGRLPEIEREMEELRTRLDTLEQEKASGRRLEEARAAAIARRDSLRETVAASRREHRKHSLETLSAAREQVKIAQEEDSRASKNLEDCSIAAEKGIFGGLDARESRLAAEADLQKYSSAQKQTETIKPKTSLIISVVLAFAALAALLSAAFALPEVSGFWKFIPGILAVLCSAGMIFRYLRLKKLWQEAAAEAEGVLLKYSCQAPEEIRQLLQAHITRLDALDQARAEKAETSAALESVKRQQDKLDAEILQKLDFSSPDKNSPEAMLEQAEAELHLIRERLAQWEGRRDSIGSGEEILQRLEKLTVEHRDLTMQFNALNLAAETLNQAGEELQSRVAPKLSARASELFSALTGGVYESVALDLQLMASARRKNDVTDREASFLSVGALDQLYLAVRLALCELVLPREEKCPIILDDALINFDDERCRLALELLLDLAQDQQIILFSCHSREANIMENVSGVNIVRGGKSNI